jgi:hypothetical protein
VAQVAAPAAAVLLALREPVAVVVEVARIDTILLLELI